ncbi:MAG: AMMECR1 domain-containing protein, partial [Planctomycetes bacterium]|nr:AMMECR1 domain-containing protein [Planctomycetota bacterium]
MPVPGVGISRRGFESWLPESLRTRSETMFTVQEITDPKQLRMLLRIARRTAEADLGAPRTVGEESVAIEGRYGGVFVTFCRGKRLRGCVGSFAATDNIEGTIRDVTCKSLVD